MAGKTILVWFRNDLRIHDNEILLEATLKGAQIIPVYIFDTRYYQSTHYKTLKTGLLRTKFTLESVADLKKSLQDLGGDLLIKVGVPEEILPEITKQYDVDEVYHHREVAFDETEISSSVEDALWKQQINLKHFIGHTLYHKEDLPFPIKDIPDAFPKFRKKVEREGEIRALFDSPTKITVASNLEKSELPTLLELGFEARDLTDTVYEGGETAAIDRLNTYLWETDSLKDYKQKRYLSLGINTTTKLSPWLSLGCISPRKVYWELKQYEKEKGSANNANLVFIELLWRDYYRFMFKKHSSISFMKGDPENVLEQSEQELLDQWKLGKTAIPFINASMHELKATGFLAYKGRLAVASYLVNDLKVNWAWGAAYFEEQLIDYAPASNWGNWAQFANFNNELSNVKSIALDKQIKESDPKGEYVEKWA